jgi:hypothetical protein
VSIQRSYRESLKTALLSKPENAMGKQEYIAVDLLPSPTKQIRSRLAEKVSSLI